MYIEPEFEPTRDEMLEIIDQNIKPLQKTERVMLEDALFRLSGEEICAEYDLPNRPVSMFDGISVRFSDFISDTVDTSSWKEDIEYSFSNTGVAIKEEYDTVIAIEDVEFDSEGKLTVLLKPENAGENVGKIGGQMRRGEILVKEGECITPEKIGILAAAGIMNLKVIKKPIVSFLPTGDELVPVGAIIPPGKNAESNSYMVAASIRQWGGNPIRYPILPDQKDVLKKMLLQAVKSSDLVLICAGSSKGTCDYTMEVLREIGSVIVQELGHGPGKHCSLSMVENVPVIGLPGPPGGTKLASRYYVKAAMAKLMGQPLPRPETVRAVLTDRIEGNWIDFIIPLKVEKEGDIYYAAPVDTWGMTRAKAQYASNGCFYCPKETNYKKGDVIDIELLG
ncbi:MAG: molybdopterin molybdotransferase MoeA [Lachnospiraceae bacterium]|nr:molybdopterin molybdotransferase MoeA [Lachnospiraceae bacterium]